MQPFKPYSSSSMSSFTSSSTSSTSTASGDTASSMSESSQQEDMATIFSIAQEKLKFGYVLLSGGSNEHVLNAMEMSLNSVDCPDAVKMNFFNAYSHCMNSTIDHGLRTTIQLMSYRISVNHASKGTRFDISGLNLSGLTLSDLTFSRVNASNTDFTGAKLTGTSFVHANLTNTIFRNAQLLSADMDGAQFWNNDFNGANVFNLRTNNPVFRTRIDRTRIENIETRVEVGVDETATQQRTVQIARFVLLPQSSCAIL